MSRKIVTIVAALSIALASSFALSGDSVACDKAAKTAKADAAKASCSSAAKTASAKSGCSRSSATTASMKTASKGSCCMSAATAEVASASGCSESAAVAGASGCSKSAAAAHAGCEKGAAASVAGMGCDKAASADYAKSGCCAKDGAVKASLAEVVDVIPYLEPKRLVLDGAIQCGKCTYKASAHCTPLFKTADGKVYPLVDNNLVEKMRHTDAADGFEVSTNVRNLDGMKYLEVKAFKSL